LIHFYKRQSVIVEYNNSAVGWPDVWTRI